MTRRKLLAASLAAGAASSSAQTAPKGPAWLELRYFRMRTDQSEQNRRTVEYLSKGWLPAARRAGAGPIGLFNGVIAANMPFALRLASYPSLAAMEAAREKLAADAEHQKALAEYNAGPVPGFGRMESWILRAFDSFPAIEPPPGEAQRAARIFELRTYESLNESTLRQKIRMFGEGGETALFRKNGILPVMFAEAIAGANLPHLVYMVTFANLAEREKNWAAFNADPGWQKLRGSQEYGTPGLTSNITSAILAPLAGSDLR